MAVRHPALRELADMNAALSGHDPASDAIEISYGTDGRIAGAQKGNRIFEVVRDEMGRAVAINPVN